MLAKILLEELKRRRARVGVVGMGYVGLPLALSLAEDGFPVTGLDIDQRKLQSLQKGVLTFAQREPKFSELLRSVLKKNAIAFSSDYGDLRSCRAIVVTVQTPLASDRCSPDYSVLLSAATRVAKVFSPGTLIVIQSTIAPGTSRSLLLPLLMRESKKVVGEDFWYAYCPERVMPGRMLSTLHDLPRIIGGDDVVSRRAATYLYQPITRGRLDATTIVTAEFTKTAENSHRYLEISYANALALLCEQYGISYQDVHRLANMRDNVHLLQPGVGIGGHCIPKDPWLLVWKHPRSVLTRLFRTTDVVNRSMARHVVNLLLRGLREFRVPIKHANIAILGFAFREGSDDIREAPAARVVFILDRKKIRYTIHDSFVPTYQGDVQEILRGKDAVLVLTAHPEYRKLSLPAVKRILKHPLIIDGRQTWDVHRARRLGFLYYQIGDVPRS